MIEYRTRLGKLSDIFTLDFLVKNLSYRLSRVKEINVDNIKNWLAAWEDNKFIFESSIIFDETIWEPLRPENYKKIVLITFRLNSMMVFYPVYFSIDRGLDNISFDRVTWTDALNSSITIIE